MMDTTLGIAPDQLVQEQAADQLAARSKAKGEQLTDGKRKQLNKISQDFEALFTGMMLKSMRATVPKDTLLGGGNAEATYRSMLDQEYAAAASKRGGAGGIAAMIEKELLKRYAVPTRTNAETKSEEH